MKVCFDTSVLVAAMVDSHPDHNGSLTWLQKVISRKVHGTMATHTLAELYAVLTSLPVKPRLDPAIVLELLKGNVFPHFEVVELASNDYKAVIDQLCEDGITGGATYDGLIAFAARKAKADFMLTLNPGHFNRFGSTLTVEVRSP